jgi:hypothetical protein
MQPELDEQLLRESRHAIPDPNPAAVRRGVAQLLARGERAARRRRRPLVGALAAAAVLAAALAAVAGERAGNTLRPGATPAAAAVDRTFACRLHPGMPLRIRVSPVRTIWMTSEVSHDVPPFVAVGSGPPQATWPFVRVRSVFFRHAGFVGHPAYGPPGVHVATARCTPTGARIALSQTGLAGLPVHYDKTVNCYLSGRVLVRVRARLAAPTRWGRVDGTYGGVQRRVLESWVAVRAERPAAPVAFARMRGSATSVWYSERCS